MSGTPAPDNLYFTLLQRVIDIAKLATWTNADGQAESIRAGIPRRFTPINGPFPLVLAFVSGVRYVKATKYEDHFVSVTLQIWAGGVAAGYVGENEDRLNTLYMVIPKLFADRPYLNSPTDGTNFDYIMPDDAAGLSESPNGTDGYEVTDGNGVSTRYFGTEFNLPVHLRIPRNRLS